MIDTEVRNMMKFVDKIFGSPHFLGELLFFGKYVALLQFVLSFVFLGLAHFGGPLGSLEYSEVFQERAFVTLILTFVIEFFARHLRSSE